MSGISEKDFADIFLTNGTDSNYGISQFTQTLSGKILSGLKGQVSAQNDYIREFITKDLLPYKDTDSSEFVGVIASNVLPKWINSSGFKYPTQIVNLIRGFIPGENHHDGLDIGVTQGSNVYTIDDGVVVFSNDGYNGGYGGRIVILHQSKDSSNFFSTYSHIFKRLVNTGDNVTKGTIIGLSGGLEGTFNAGHSKGAHLHFELAVSLKNGKGGFFKASLGEYKNPGPIFNKYK